MDENEMEIHTIVEMKLYDIRKEVKELKQRVKELEDSKS